MIAAGVSSWNRFVEAAGRDVRAIDDGIRSLGVHGEQRAASLATIAFRVGLASLLVGAEEVGRLAIAIERGLDAVVTGKLLLSNAVELLHTPREVLLAALGQLENPDKSGARIEGLPMVEVTNELIAALEGRADAASVRREIAWPARHRTTPPPAAQAEEPAPAPAASAGAFVWTPAVDEDMIELFFDEARERIEGISSKLIALEQQAGDPELLRDLFRDLHTVKGSSAMVGLEPVNRLAHAAEDLVGQLRDGGRPVDAPVIDALLATLDALRDMLDVARAKRPIELDPTPILHALRDPASHAKNLPKPGQAPAASAPNADAPASRRAAPKTEKASAEAVAQAQAAARQTIRVDFDKLDRLLNLVGELVLGRDGLRSAYSALSSVTGELSADRAVAQRSRSPRSTPRQRPAGASTSFSIAERSGMQDFAEELGRVERVLASIASDLDTSTGYLDSISSELRDQVMRLRMVPIGGIFRKHQRTVRDLGQTLGKKIVLDLWGEDTELDKLLVEALDEPLMHLVRNAVDHGIEGPADREAAGKPATGTLRLEASHRGNQVLIRIADDGRGMDAAKLKKKALEKGIATEAELAAMDERAAFELIFRPGFSTAATVSDVSGRGVGMDVVRQTIVTRLKGTIDIDSALGRGSTFVLRLPLTLAIIQVLLARVCGETFAIPLDAVERTIVVPSSQIRLVGDREVFETDGRTLPLVRLGSVLELEGPESEDDSHHVVLTEQGGDLYGLSCDHLIGKKEIVIKSLGELLASVPCTAGATLLGDRCALILDVPAIVHRALRRPTVTPRAPKRAAVAAKGTVLLVDDSDTVRESLRRLLADAGYDVTTAEDGREALALCKARRFDIVSTDVMMPHMDGYELTRALRAMPDYRDVPIVMVTSRGERIDRVRGFDAGVDEYITKPHDRQLLLRAIQKLLGHVPEVG